jgi:transcriptional regulator with XRE-family HTH domain
MLNLNEIILKSGKKKHFIAQKLGISKQSLTRYCQGYTSPTADVLWSLAKLLEVDISDFFKNDTLIELNSSKNRIQKEPRL